MQNYSFQFTQYSEATGNLQILQLTMDVPSLESRPTFHTYPSPCPLQFYNKQVQLQ